MEKKYRILFLIRRYNATDGASQALCNFIRNNDEIAEYKILCRWIVKSQDDVNIQTVNNKNEIKKELKSRQYDLVHYFKTGGYDMFNWTYQAIKSLHLKLPIITTVCQRPSYPGLLLSPHELKYSTKIVLIDKASYNDELYQFVNENKKDFIYFGTPPDVIEKTGQLVQIFQGNGNTVVYGRGSTLSKCPKDMISVFDAIDIEKKKFVIAGITAGSWLHSQVENREDIKIYSPRPFAEWLDICNSFDVFLYYIPTTSHSSIDGTLGNAMLLQKPVVYYGSEAPKERIIHGENGFVANSISEIAYYATLLGKDEELRRKIGKKARETTIKEFSIFSTIENYHNLYLSVINSDIDIKQVIPIRYILHFFKKSKKQYFRYLLAGSFVEKIYRRFKPLKV